ncbi:unnamed protein product [Acanthoscelides obtectus]|uniref:Bromodomain adjacent to zinc finger domain protein 1A n=1 Tax=Acanthoscelides obtectus TaxID=200917 RepID=A0A9P0NWG2_ACAOB|nr:unnamed protein product [Acanthoscelides obtectus]CAK1663826.1 Bromodomain adjacent to zinc finger domain protein 1A [Acanthoscelides obtectus]
MPLLKKVHFEKAPIPENLKDSDEVFYCEFTDEIFRDYEEYSEKIILYNSMVWTCAFTGKTNLTYIEALESEEQARKSIQEFSVELRIPLLYLATKTQRTSFMELSEDVFMYMKNRYFIGENIEASFTGNKWKDCHILQVMAPTDPLPKTPRKNGAKNEDRQFWPPATAYKYEIEHMDAEDNDISEIMIVDCSQLRRKKAAFNREKCKLFLKQYVEQDDRRVFVVKPSVLADFGIFKVKWDQIFDGPLPDFEFSPVKKKSPYMNGKKQKQETLANFLMRSSKTNGANKERKQSNLLEQLKKREEEFKLKKQQEHEQKLAKKQMQKQESNLLISLTKKWYRPKEDLSLENQQKLPVLYQVISKIPEEHFGSVLMIAEFAETFSKLLATKDFFPGGLTLDVLERAMTELEISGPFADIIQMFLTALFNAQDEESSQYRTTTEDTADIKDEELQDDLSMKDVTRLATLASKWSSRYLGLPLAKLPLYAVTVTEILRLHLLSSGVRINETGYRWRYAQRGGYTNEADPGLHLRLEHPHILRALGTQCVIELPIEDKLRIIDCLMNQLLTYADVRDIVEEKLESTKELKLELKSVQLAERKRHGEYLANKSKLQKEMIGDPKLQDELEKLQKEAEKKHEENTNKIEELHKSIYESVDFLGHDRAFRKYLKLNSIPGLFVNWEGNNGECLSEVVHQYSNLVNPSTSILNKYFRENFINKSDGSPKKSPKKFNGSLNGSLTKQDEHTLTDLLMCNTDPETCKVHSDKVKRPKWLFIHDKNQLEEFENTLNPRGEREGELLSMIKNNKERLMALIEETPVTTLNPNVKVPQSEDEDQEQKSKKTSKRGKNKYEDVNLGYPVDMNPQKVLENALVDNILELEEKMSAGGLGKLSVKNREAWRNCLQSKEYDSLNEHVTKDKKVENVKKENRNSNSRSATPEIPSKEEKYQDPAKFLGCTESESADIEQQENLKKSLKALTTALTQVAYSLEPKYLKKPLGHAEGWRSKKSHGDLLDKWEQSLAASTSFSQIFLHYLTLDSCIMWSRSALLARCRICRRQKDSENMLLCDNCNLGHHLYCLKPKLSSIPQGDWFCDRCKKEKEKEERLKQPSEPQPAKKRKIFVDEDVEEEESGEEEDDVDEEEEDDDADEERLCKRCGSGGEVITCEKCSVYYHLECCKPPMRRAPRGAWTCEKCKNKSETKRKRSSSPENGARTGGRRNDRYLPLHNAALQELLSDVIKHDDAWPFLKPVQKSEVPDYYEVIEKPMDFGTIKYKLNMGEYSEDSEVMDDVVLIFENCNTYNNSDAEVYKCGVRLLKYFAQKAKELDLEVPEELEVEEEQRSTKRSRNK